MNETAENPSEEGPASEGAVKRPGTGCSVPDGIRFLKASELRKIKRRSGIPNARKSLSPSAIGVEIDQNHGKQLVSIFRVIDLMGIMCFIFPVLAITVIVCIAERKNFFHAIVASLLLLGSLIVIPAWFRDKTIIIIEPVAIHYRRVFGILGRTRLFRCSDITEVIHRISLYDKAEPRHSVGIALLTGETKVLYLAGENRRNAEWMLDVIRGVLRRPVRETTESLMVKSSFIDQNGEPSE